MSESQPKGNPTIYRIKIKGHLEDRWVDWFEGMTLIYENDGSTTLHGPLTDQPALHGILNKIRDLNLKLISVERDESLPADLHDEN